MRKRMQWLDRRHCGRSNDVKRRLRLADVSAIYPLGAYKLRIIRNLGNLTLSGANQEVNDGQWLV